MKGDGGGDQPLDYILVLKIERSTILPVKLIKISYTLWQASSVKDLEWDYRKIKRW